MFLLLDCVFPSLTTQTRFTLFAKEKERKSRKKERKKKKKERKKERKSRKKVESRPKRA